VQRLTNPAIRAGLNLVPGKVTHRAVAETFGMPYREA
jgi:alanine dehydrogenase